jgi:hypothetical protein
MIWFSVWKPCCVCWVSLMSIISNGLGSVPFWYRRSSSDSSPAGRLLTGRIQAPNPFLTISFPATHRPEILRELAKQIIRFTYAIFAALPRPSQPEVVLVNMLIAEQISSVAHGAPKYERDRGLFCGVSNMRSVSRLISVSINTVYSCSLTRAKLAQPRQRAFARRSSGNRLNDRKLPHDVLALTGPIQALRRCCASVRLTRLEALSPSDDRRH